VAELRQLTGAAAEQQQQQHAQEAGVAQGAVEAAAVQALSHVLDVNDYSARSLVDQEPALLEVKEKQMKVGRQEGWGRGMVCCWWGPFRAGPVPAGMRRNRGASQL
jgi:hypothetical protein